MKVKVSSEKVDMSASVDTQLLERIDKLELSQRAARLREEFFSCQPGVAGERVKLAMESWKETEGESLDLRNAKALKKVVEGMPVVIFRGQMLVGSDTKYFRGANPQIDYNSTFMAPLLKEVPGQVTLGGPVERGLVTQADHDIFIEAMDYWKGKTATERANQVVKAAMGSWYDDLVKTGVVPYEERRPNPQCVNWEKLVHQGLEGIIAEAEGYMRKWVDSQEDDVEKLYFWQAAIMGLKAAITLARRYSKLAKEMAAVEQDPRWRAELEEIAEVCQWVPEKPARTFREALQSIILVNVAMRQQCSGSGAGSTGLVDQYLYPYFKRDLDQGTLSLEKAADLVSDLLLDFNREERVEAVFWRDLTQKGSPNNIGLGGPNKQGDDASNELTYLILHAMGLVKYIEPHLAFRWHKATPKWIMRKAMETNLRVGGGVPQFINSEHIVPYFTERGIPLENARYYQTIGCAEVVPWNWGIPMKPTWINASLFVDLALHDGKASKTGKQIGPHTGDPRQFATFDQFYDVYKKQFEYVTRKQFWHDRLVDEVTRDMLRQPLAAALLPGCLEKGKGFFDGGLPHYDCWQKRDRGFVPTGDSLMAIKKLVYDEHKVSMGEMVEALDSNFAGERGEAIRQLCESAPKYGNDIDEVDRMVGDVAKFSASVITSEKNIFGEHYQVTRDGMAWHFMAGKRMAALPNGRKAGEPLADGSLSATQGMDTNGPTALINSALKADFEESAVAVLNVKFPAPLLRSLEMRDKVASLTESYFRRGGSYIQYNILDAEALRQAKLHPEKYRDLVVRVGGFSAYFVALSPEVQDELIKRSEQSL